MIIAFRVYLLWIFDDYFNTLINDITEQDFSSLSNLIQIWSDLFKRTLITEKDQLIGIIVLEKVIEIRPQLEKAFSHLINELKKGIITEEVIRQWKILDRASYDAFSEGEVDIDNDLHQRLLNKLN